MEKDLSKAEQRRRLEEQMRDFFENGGQVRRDAPSDIYELLHVKERRSRSSKTSRGLNNGHRNSLFLVLRNDQGALLGVSMKYDLRERILDSSDHYQIGKKFKIDIYSNADSVDALGGVDFDGKMISITHTVLDITGHDKYQLQQDNTLFSP